MQAYTSYKTYVSQNKIYRPSLNILKKFKCLEAYLKIYTSLYHGTKYLRKKSEQPKNTQDEKNYSDC